jgi:hypothetical protein
MLRAQLASPGTGRIFGLSAAAFCLLLVPSLASATNCSYSINVADTLSMLQGGSPMNTTAAEWAYLRKHPYLELTNTSTDPTAQLSNFILQLNNLTQDIKITKIVSDDGVTVNSPNPTPGPSGSSIRMSFSNFDPGDSVIFRVELDPATSKDTQFADYRQIFFKYGDMSGDTSKNAQTSVTFTDPTIDATIPPTGPDTWPNPSGDAAKTVFGIAFSCMSAPDQSTPPANNGGSVPVPTPEPSTMILGGLGVLGLLVSRKKLGSKQA